MDTQRFDAFARAVSHRLPRRGLLGVSAASVAGVAAGLTSPRRTRAQATPAGPAEMREISVSCRPCHCDEAGENCECCLNGVTGGGVVRTEGSDVTLVVFATALGDETERQATGFVRWIDPVMNGGTTLESVGPIAYAWQDLETPESREIRGTMAVNGAGEEPFVLRVAVSSGETAGTAWLEVGSTSAQQGASEAFAYAAMGDIIAGDLQLLDGAAAI